MNHRFAIFTVVIFLFFSCNSDKIKLSGLLPASPDTDSVSTDTLRVAMLYGPNDYFNFAGQSMGYNYELVQNYASFSAKTLKVMQFRSEKEMFVKLREKEVDLVAASIYETRVLKSMFHFAGHQDPSYLVLVQRLGLNTITEPNELKGKTVHVINHSSAYERLKNMSSEIGGAIDIVVLPDTLHTGNLIEMVAQKKIEFAVADHKTASIYREAYPKLDVRMRIGFTQRNGWLVRQSCDSLIYSLEKWSKDDETAILQSVLFEKYRIRNPFFSSQKMRIPRGSISPYDHYFKKFAAEIQWDWRMLASIAFHESRFDSAQISPRGASGLMQLMPRTAANFGLNRQNIFNPGKNIEAGVQYIKSLNMMFRKIENKEERVKFILAAYNSGPAHILDAMALAEKYGRNPHIWFGHVDYYLEKKNDPQFYNDEVVRYGQFRSGYTLKYVRNVLQTFHKYNGGV
jgi:membrane-bound lytic murein transglycosylase F